MHRVREPRARVRRMHQEVRQVRVAVLPRCARAGMRRAHHERRAHRYIKNALGDKLHSKLRRVLVKKNAEHRGIAPPSGKSASSCEANPDGEDEDYDMRMPADPEPPGPAHASTLSVALAAVERFATDVSGPRASHRVPSSMRDAELTYV